MNSLSWFLYFAQIVGSVGNFFMFIGVIGFVGWIAANFINFIAIMVETEGDRTKFKGQKFLFVKLRWMVLAFIIILLSNLTPTKETMYAIAASQVGEQIVNSEAAKGVADDASKALRSWIHKQLIDETDHRK